MSSAKYHIYKIVYYSLIYFLKKLIFTRYLFFMSSLFEKTMQLSMYKVTN